MAAPFTAPLPSPGQKPWTLNPVVEEVRSRIRAVDDLTTTGRLSEVTLNAQIADVAAAIDAPGHLDIWDPVASMTADYATFITQLDAAVGSGAVKVTAGTGSGPSAHPIYHYTAGHGLKHVLLIGGQHGFEVYGAFAAREFFVKFATSGDPAMRALRQQITLHFIPVAVPHAFARFRSNGNGVDINRNYDWNWSKFVADDKGSAPLDQPEPQIIKQIMDDHPIELLIDCHSMGDEPDTPLQTATAGPLILNKRTVAERALQMFQLANPDAPAATYYGIGKTTPSLRNWAQKYLRFNKRRQGAQTVLIECTARLGGAPEGQFNRQGIRWYASLIYNHVQAWLQFGLVDEQIPNFTWIGGLNTSDTSGGDVEVTDGGRRISSNTYEAVKFLVTSGVNNRSSIVVPIRHPGRYVAFAKVNLENAGATAVRVLGGMAFLSDSTGNIVPTVATVSSRRLAAGEIGTLDIMGSWNFTAVPADTLYELQLLLRVESAGQVVTIRPYAGISVQMTVSPAFEPYELPVTN